MLPVLPRFRDRPAHVPLIWLAGGTLLYLLLFFLLYPQFGPLVTALAVMPVAVTAWLMGIRAGIIAGVVAIGFNLLLLSAVSAPVAGLLPHRFLFPHALLVLLGGLAGRASELVDRVRQQALALAQAREVLRVQVFQREQAEAARQAAESRLGSIMQSVMDAIVTVDAGQRIVFFNRAAEQMFGYAADEILGQPLDVLIPEQFQVAHRRHVDRFRREEYSQRADARMKGLWGRRADGSRFPIDALLSRVEFNGEALFTAVVRDVTAQSQTQVLLAGQQKALEMIARNAPLADVLTRLLALSNLFVTGKWAGGVYFLDQEANRLLLQAASGLPESYQETVRVIPVDPEGGPCGRSAYLRKAIFVEDIAADPLWEAHREVALQHGLWACWSVPILSTDDEVIGVLALYHRETRRPDDTDRQLIAVMTHIISLTIERDRTGRALADERNLMHTLLEAIPSFIYVKDTQARFVMVNAAMLRELGADSREDVIGKTDFDFYPDDLAERYYADDRMVMTTGRPLINREEPGLDATGRPHWVLTTKVPRRDSTGQIIGLVGITRDITERRRMEETLRRLNAELEQRVAERTAEIRAQHQRIVAILDSVADAVVVTNLDGHVVLANPMAQHLLGEAPADADLSRRLSDMMTYLTVHPDRVYTEVLEVGQMAYQAKAACVQEDSEPAGFVIVLRDITRLRELDQLKTQFVNTVSHELRTPLANIKLYLSLLRKRPERQEQYMTVMDREAARLDRLICDLLDLSRLETEGGDANREIVNVAELITHVVEANTLQAEGKRLNLSANLHLESNVTLLAHRDQMVQMLTNLVANAIYYTPEGGMISVDAHPGVMHDGGEKRPALVIEVVDNGMGIAPEDLPYIFDRFFRGQNAASGEVPGTGLGLAITREIVNRHYGKIEVESRLNEGSVFRVVLPLIGADNHAARPEAEVERESHD